MPTNWQPSLIFVHGRTPNGSESIHLRMAMDEQCGYGQTSWRCVTVYRHLSGYVRGLTRVTGKPAPKRCRVTGSQRRLYFISCLRIFWRNSEPGLGAAKLKMVPSPLGTSKNISRCARKNYFTSNNTPTQTRAAESQRRRSTFSCSRNLAMMAEQI